MAEASHSVSKYEYEESSKDEVSKDNSDGEVDLEDELIYALQEIEKCRRRNKYLKGKLSKYQEEINSKEEEVRTLQEELHNSKKQVMASMREVESLKQEVAEFKEEVKKLKDQLNVSEKLNISIEALNKVIILQKFPRDKIGLGYDKKMSLNDHVGSLKRMLKKLKVGTMIQNI